MRWPLGTTSCSKWRGRRSWRAFEEPEAILYRQHVLADCLERSDVVREMYVIAVEAIEREKENLGRVVAGTPTGCCIGPSRCSRTFGGVAQELRQLADEHGAQISLRRLHELFAMLAAELERRIPEHRRGPSATACISRRRSVSAELGEGDKGTQYVLRKPRYTNRVGWRRLRVG